MKWYLKAIKQYADFQTRARRKEYWMVVLFNIIISFILFFIDFSFFIDENNLNAQFPIFSLLYSLFMFIPSLAVTVRRLHDAGKSGWNILFGLIPILGTFILLYFYFLDSVPGENKWGPNPKETVQYEA